MSILLQQGDVLIKKLLKLPENLKLKNNNIVAVGEVTGHYHEVIGSNVETFYDEFGNLFLNVNCDDAIISHQEHKHFNIPLGIYEIGIVREYDHFAEEARMVRD